MHIVGFGLAYEETDVWYVLTHRKRRKRKEENKINNHIYYYVVDKFVDENKNALLKAMDVEIVVIPAQNTDKDNNLMLFDKLKEKIGIR